MRLGQRVARGRDRGTVRFIGTLDSAQEEQNSNNIYIGVEWDDPNRGKHARGGGPVFHPVAVENVLFVCRVGTSGSLVPKESLSVGQTLISAVNEKYVEVDASNLSERSGVVFERSGNVDFNGNRSSDSAGGGVEVELVGFLGVQRQMSDISTLQQVLVGDMDVNELHSGAPLAAAVELDVSGNLVSSLDNLLEGARVFPSLSVLIANRSRFAAPFFPRPVESAPALLRVLVLGNCALDWSTVVSVGLSLPFLRELFVSHNAIIPTREENNASNVTAAFPALEQFSLEHNGISFWSSLDSLAEMPKLRRLLLSGNALGDSGALEVWHIGDGDATASNATAAINVRRWAALTELSLADCNIEQWSTIDALNQLPGLRRLRVEPGNPVTAIGPGASRRTVIARVSGLTVLNSSELAHDERQEAEKYYLKQTANDVLKHGRQTSDPAFLGEHPRWAELTAQYGTPVADKPIAETLAQEMITVTLSCAADVGNAARPGEKEKRLPLSFAVADLRALFVVLFGLDKERVDRDGLVLRIVDKHEPAAEILDDDTRSIGYFNARNGSRIIAANGDLKA